MMRLLFAAIALAVLATACSGGGSTGPTPTPTTSFVRVVEAGTDGQPVMTFVPLADVGRYASTQVRFPVRLPSHLPPGYMLTEIDLPAGAPATGLQVSLKILNGSGGGLSIIVSNALFDVDEDPSHLIWNGGTEAQIYKDGGVYSFVTAAYVVELTVGAPNPNPPSDAEVIEVLTSLRPSGGGSPASHMPKPII